MRNHAALGALVLLALAIGCAHAPLCDNPQSPRNIDPQTAPYDGTSTRSTAELKDPDRLIHRPRAGGPEHELERCGQHFHFPIENRQGCRGEPPAGSSGPVKPMPAPGDRIEVHTVYAAEAQQNGCDTETLDCCKKAPFMVLAFSARITPGGEPARIEPSTARPMAQWTGSTTGREKEPGECKPEAQWSFNLGCGTTVSEGQLSLFHHIDPARPLQHGRRLSNDLFLVE